MTTHLHPWLRDGAPRARDPAPGVVVASGASPGSGRALDQGPDR